MDFKSELLKTNQKLANQGIKLRIEQRGNKLSLRGQLPSQRNPAETKDQRISLGLETNMEGLSKAEKKLNFLSLQIEHKQFDWRNWSKQKQKISALSTQNNLEKI